MAIQRFMALSRFPAEKVLGRKITVNSVQRSVSRLTGVTEYMIYFLTLGKVNLGLRRYKEFAELMYWISDIQLSEDGKKLTVLIERKDDDIRVVLFPTGKSVSYYRRDKATGTDSVFDYHKPIRFYTEDLTMMKDDIVKTTNYFRYSYPIDTYLQKYNNFMGHDDHSSGTSAR